MSFKPLPRPKPVTDGPFLQPIPAGWPRHPNSTNIVAWMVANGGDYPTIHGQAGFGGTSKDFSHAVYRSTYSSPRKTIRQGYAGARDKNPALEGKAIFIPAKAKQAAWQAASSTINATTVDGSIMVQQPAAADGSYEEVSCWGVVEITATEIHCGFAKSVRIHPGTGLAGSATAYPGGWQSGGIVAGGWAPSIGVVSLNEHLSGTINHRLYCSNHGWHGKQWPAATTGGSAGEVASTNAPHMGEWLAVDLVGFDIRPLPKWQQGWLTCLATYGVHVGDYGGGPMDGRRPFLFNLQIESETPYRAFRRSPTNLEYADQVLGHSGAWSLQIPGFDWRQRLHVLAPAQP